MNKFLFVFISLCLFAPIQGLRRNRLKEFHRRRLNGDLHPKHRRLSQHGQLNLKIDGRGYFQYRLRVDADTTTDNPANDPSQKAPDGGEYDQAYAAAPVAPDTDGGKPAANAAAGSIDENDGNGPTAGKPGDGVESATDGDNAFFSQVVYSKDGSLHVNKYGYLCDDNGLLLVSDGSSRSSDANAKFHIHIPSRAEDILITPTGKVMVVELGGAAFTKVGQIRLARFENAQGLNIRLKMRSNCNAADEDGFALGNWCAGTELDGKQHTYYAETDVSGVGILGSPGSQGFGRIIKKLK